MIRFGLFSDNENIPGGAITIDSSRATINFSQLFSENRSLRITANLSLRAAGSMRFRLNEENQNRTRFFSELGIRPVTTELVHSKKVFACENAEDIRGARGDGIITKNPLLAPAITVADCMPIFLANFAVPCFGILHSGWRGTGIVCEAIELARSEYGARTEDFFVVLGPHVQSCCYTVDKERANFFAKEFTPDCVDFPHLSLAKANLHLLASCGVPDAHIALCADCTSCDTRFGSFRREAAHLDMPLEEKIKHFTAMAAWTSASIS